MEWMELTLRETVASAIARADGYDYEYLKNKTGPDGVIDQESFRALADAALAALGLDDLDAAVERAARVLASENGGHAWPYRKLARAALEAALTATNSTGGDDGNG